MDEKFIWPLVGVFLGWMLTTIASARKDREENRRLVGRLLTQLIGIYCEVQLLKKVTEAFKEYAGDWETFEYIRQRATDKHFLEPASKMKLLEKSIHDFSGVYPLESFDLQFVRDHLVKTKNQSFPSPSESKEVYVKLLSTHEVIIDHLESEMLKFIRSLSFKHSLITYVRVRLLLRKRKKNAETANEFIDKNYGELLSSLSDKP